MKKVSAIFVAYVAVVVVFWVAIAYVAIHFVRKYW